MPNLEYAAKVVAGLVGGHYPRDEQGRLCLSERELVGLFTQVWNAGHSAGFAEGKALEAAVFADTVQSMNNSEAA
jgi:hypothetical protein